MVTLRRSSRRVGRPSSAAKSSSPTRSAIVQPIPVNNSTNPSSSTLLIHNPTTILSSSNIPFQNQSSILSSTTNSIPDFSIQNGQVFNFDGIQYSPYFLAYGDNPGTSLISEVLDGSNYNTWNIAITIALDAKNKIAFVDGSLPRPIESHPHFRIWSRCNSMVKSWILNSVTKPIYGSILRFNDA